MDQWESVYYSATEDHALTQVMYLTTLYFSKQEPWCHATILIGVTPLGRITAIPDNQPKIKKYSILIVEIMTQVLKEKYSPALRVFLDEEWDCT